MALDKPAACPAKWIQVDDLQPTYDLNGRLTYVGILTSLLIFWHNMPWDRLTPVLHCSNCFLLVVLLCEFCMLLIWSPSLLCVSNVDCWPYCRHFSSEAFSGFLFSLAESRYLCQNNICGRVLYLRFMSFSWCRACRSVSVAFTWGCWLLMRLSICFGMVIYLPTFSQRECRDEPPRSIFMGPFGVTKHCRIMI